MSGLVGVSGEFGLMIPQAVVILKCNSVLTVERNYNMSINYIKGDATCPQAKGTKLVVHIVNTLGKWGKGFVLAVSKRWEKPEIEYRNWYAKGKDFKLGAVQFVQVEDWIWVANMIGQNGIYSSGSSGPPIRYEAVEECLKKVAKKA